MPNIQSHAYIYTSKVILFNHPKRIPSKFELILKYDSHTEINIFNIDCYRINYFNRNISKMNTTIPKFKKKKKKLYLVCILLFNVPH